MYISYKHEVIFIHCRKAAGSSISYYLSQVGGARDLQLSSIKETLDSGKLPPLRTLGSAFSNRDAYIALTETLLSGKGIRNAIARAAKRSFKNRLGPKPQHASAEVIKSAFRSEWGSFQSFCVVRNPFDMAVSDYFWRTRELDRPPSFNYYLSALKDGNSLNGLIPIDNYYNWPKYTSNDQVIVNEVLKFENLLNDIQIFFEKSRIPFLGILPNLKSTHRPKYSKYRSLRDFYSDENMRLVKVLYEEEIEYFKYDLK